MGDNYGYQPGYRLLYAENRLSGTVEVYNKLTDGILYNPTLSPTLSGFSSPRQNIAEVTNKGLEITLGWNDRIGSVSYGISGNFSYNKNEVTKYKGELVRGWQQNAMVVPLIIPIWVRFQQETCSVFWKGT